MTLVKPLRLLGATTIALAALTVAACGSANNTNTSSSPPKTTAGRPATLGVQDAGIGKILDNGRGRTLYLFKKDAGMTSACTGACATAWPPLRAGARPVVGAGLTASLLGTSKRSDGTPQVTYNGHPLYTFQGDKKPGDTNGEGLTAFGGGWFAVSPSGNQVSAKAPAPASGY